ncbi:ecto-NOX disulfide-thiol exchanger 2 isoform X2 [Ambystoma mexicanum]|uniref:ecto-NOX disulfide-thiol exchanger 2 isoform X2 n=1 Tax=Ambystoma mexicanum TaxID=8296 RepID=UPI0037E8C7BE
MFLVQYTGLNQLTFDPSTNNEPLHFGNASAPLVSEVSENGGESSNKRKRMNIPPEFVYSLPDSIVHDSVETGDGVRSMGIDTSPMGLPISDPTAWATAMNNLGMTPMGLAGQPLLPDFDPALGMMTGIPPINPMMPGLGIVPPPIPPDMPVVKEIIHCKSCTLFPPNPTADSQTSSARSVFSDGTLVSRTQLQEFLMLENWMHPHSFLKRIEDIPPPATRERPPGCKTVFVGGLPENATEQLIVEIFEQCGEIIAIRKSKKNFCHIRFAEEFMVDKALYLSGYRIRLGSSTDKKDTGRLHVDFARARDDFYEWECKQRMLAREERHRRRMEEDRFRPPSPPPVVHYSDHECSIVSEKLKDDSKFREAIQTLLTWIERGEVNRRTANNFYSMIQSANSHIRRLMSEKAGHEKELEEAREKFKNALSGILVQFEQIVAVYNSATKQKAWDHFTKAQRKNISIWSKQAEEIRNVHSEELMGIRREEEMEMSDDELEDPSQAKETAESALQAQADALKEENDSLRWQLDAYRNEVDLLKQEQGKPSGSEEDISSQQQLQILQQALQGMQQHLLKIQNEYKKKEAELLKVRELHVLSQKRLASLRDQQAETEEEDGEKTQNENRADIVYQAETVNQAASLESTAPVLSVAIEDEECPPEKMPCSECPVKSEREALLVGIISTFLHVHPFGASIEYICSYLQCLDTKICTSEVEALMTRLQHTFQQEMSGVGASLEKRWKFCGFEGLKMT